MNYSNVITVLSTLIIAIIFFGGVFLNLDVKHSKKELYQIEQDIKKIELEISRQKITITALINPFNVLNYIEKNNLKPAKLKRVKTIYIKDDVKIIENKKQPNY